MRIFVLLPLFIYSSSIAQTSLDSLTGEWEARMSLPEDTVAVRLLLDISAAYRYDDSDSALHYAVLAENYANRLNFLRGKGEALTAKGICYYIMGAYDQSLSAHTRALEIHRQTNNNTGMALNYNGIALVYLGQENLRPAIPYLRQAVSLNLGEGNTTSLANNYFNLGITFDHLEQFDSAEYYLELAETTADLAGNFRTKLMVNNRMGETLFRQKKYREALEKYHGVLDAKYFQSNWESTFAYAGLAQTYLKLGQPEEAVRAGLKAVSYGEIVGATWDIERALGILAEAYAANHEFEKAFLTHKRFKAYSDTLFNENKETEINYILLKQKEAENRELQAENSVKEQQIRQSSLTIVVFAIAVISLALIGYIVVRSNRTKERLNLSLRQKNQNIEEQNVLIENQNEKLAELNRTNALVLSIISHDLRSPLGSLQSIVQLFKSGNISPEEQKEVYTELEKRIRNISAMMNSLLTWAGAQFSGIKANCENVNLAELSSELLLVYEQKLLEKHITARHEPLKPALVYADPSQLRIILQNLLSNALKFTHPQGSIDIFYTEFETTISVHIKDSGVGMSKETVKFLMNNTAERMTHLGTQQELGTGLGLILVRQFVEYNKGTLTILSEPGRGSEFIVNLPKNG